MSNNTDSTGMALSLSSSAGLEPLDANMDPLSTSTTTTTQQPDINDGAISLSTAIQTPPPPLIHTLAQQGDLARIRAMLDAGEALATETDGEGITALHWAAMNMHVDVCRALLERGAEVDALGGQLLATPLHWGSRSGNTYIAHVLILHGADPALTDGQGFNALHLAVHSHSPMLVAYLLSQQLPITVDSEDSAGQTSLQWAAYQGDQLSVALLLKAGADPNKADSSGLTAVHWAAVKGSVGCIAKIVDAGGDCLKKNAAQMSPVDLARRQHSITAWQRAMESIGREVDGSKRKKPLNEKNTRLAIFLAPLLTSYLILTTLSTLPWHTGLVLSAAEAYGMHHVITRVLLDAKPGLGGTKAGDALQKSPYLVALLSTSIFWVGYAWLTTLVTNTPGYAYANLFFAASCLLCAYNLFRSVTMDPGYIRPPASAVEVREVVEDLTNRSKMNGQHFCLPCMNRQPLRSRHCRHCNRCVARFDHHCPWIWNCVGVNNHRQFVCFVGTLITGILSFDYLAFVYLSTSTPYGEEGLVNPTCLFPTSICAASHFDTRIFVVTLWATIQITWTTLVIGSHIYQITKNITTYELSNLGRYGHMGTRGLSTALQEGHMANHAHSHGIDAGSPSGSQTPNPDGIGGTDPGHGRAGHVHGNSCKHGSSSSHVHSHNPLKVCARLCNRFLPSTLLAIVGLDLYTKGKGAEGMARAAEKGGGGNPFDTGLMRNCTDFWSRGRTLGVDYENLYDIPPEGFRTVIAQRKRSESQAQAARKRGSGGYEMLRASAEDV